MRRSLWRGRRRATATLQGLLIVAALVAWQRPAAATRQIFVWFADGGLAPRSVAKICSGRPPAYQCPLGPTVDACRAPLQALLDRWYADFDVVFTYAPPTSEPGADAAGPAYDTVVIASDGAWCGADPRTVSRSPLPGCTDPGAGGAVAIFSCGADTKKCATLITKEHGHLVGLHHTGSPTDVMNELGATDHDGFEDRDNLSATPRCGRLQNSYRLMLERLGAWAGGTKPGPGEPLPPNFPGGRDAVSPPDPEDGGVTGEVAPVDEPDGPVAGPDLAPGPGGKIDAAVAPAGDAGGCSCQLGGTPGAGGPALSGTLALLVCALAGTRRWARRRLRSGRSRADVSSV
jgi:hypothetical protein